MSVINITTEIVEDFMRHAESDYPHECCGFILGCFLEKESTGIKYYKAKNIKVENRERRFLIDPLSYQKAENIADKLGLSIISIVHSHPDHPDKPSDFDRDHAWPGFSYIIISVKKGIAISYKSWQLNENRKFFIEENINIKRKNNVE
tara:strand:- start:1097 stop:1540 length:444 start_codon:yes stop_codon:yes gene_type:complete